MVTIILPLLPQSAHAWLPGNCLIFTTIFLTNSLSCYGEKEQVTTILVYTHLHVFKYKMGSNYKTMLEFEALSITHREN